MNGLHRNYKIAFPLPYITPTQAITFLHSYESGTAFRGPGHACVFIIVVTGQFTYTEGKGRNKLSLFAPRCALWSLGWCENKCEMNSCDKYLRDKTKQWMSPDVELACRDYACDRGHSD